MTEAELQTAITTGTRGRPGLCKLLGLWWYHPHDSQRSPSGWVDLVILGPRGALFCELKSEDGRRTRPQIACAQRLELAGLEYRLWRPSDLRCGIITRELEALR